MISTFNLDPFKLVCVSKKASFYCILLLLLYGLFYESTRAGIDPHTICLRWVTRVKHRQKSQVVLRVTNSQIKLPISGFSVHLEGKKQILIGLLVRKHSDVSRLIFSN